MIEQPIAYDKNSSPSGRGRVRVRRRQLAFAVKSHFSLFNIHSPPCFPPTRTSSPSRRPRGGAVRGIVRAAGPPCRLASAAAFSPKIQAVGRTGAPRPGVSRHDAAGRQRRRLDCDVYLWPISAATRGQPAAEVHTLGSPPLLEAVCRPRWPSAAPAPRGPASSRCGLFWPAGSISRRPKPCWA